MHALLHSALWFEGWDVLVQGHDSNGRAEMQVHEDEM